MNLTTLESLAKAADQETWHIGHVCENTGKCDIDNRFGITIAKVYDRKNQAFIATCTPTVILELINRLREAESILTEYGCAETWCPTKGVCRLCAYLNRHSGEK